jgi:hypothetical protein
MDILSEASHNLELYMVRDLGLEVRPTQITQSVHYRKLGGRLILTESALASRDVFAHNRHRCSYRTGLPHLETMVPVRVLMFNKLRQL